ncbi:hypothetical protein AN216_00910 [Streptomyces oceani]|uniref:Lipoprotein n=1 Tax=Streptomyces oceani TaxID=1075402 RepID=A0A1E7KPW8_9ACTN|nr:hypothetical protein AN216_00910 [Streptomyces oceani]
MICLALTLALTGCGEDEPAGDTNGIADLPAEKIEKKARKAAERAGSVRLSGTVISQGQTYRLEMRLKESGGIGEVSAKGGDNFQLVRVEKDLYLKADSEFWARQENSGKDEKPSESDVTVARKLEGKYVKVPRKDPAYEQLSGFTNLSVMLGGLLVLNGERETGDESEVSGRRTIQVNANGGKGGTIDVALTGTPYPLRLQRGGSAGTVTLADWDSGFSLRAPKKDQIVDYGKKISASE